MLHHKAGGVLLPLPLPLVWGEGSYIDREVLSDENWEGGREAFDNVINVSMFLLCTCGFLKPVSF